MERLTVFILFVVFNFAGVGLVSTTTPGHDTPARAAAVKIDRTADRINQDKTDRSNLARQAVVIEDRLIPG